MSIPKIENLEEVICQYIEKNKKIVDKKIFRLTEPGENYGSEMLGIDLVLQNEETGKEEPLNVVGKLIPTSEFFRTMFHVQVTFKNETAFYNIVVPSLQEFQRKQGIEEVIDCFPKFYGARTNLENSDGKIDENAILILENLKIKGYRNVDRYVGCDLQTTKVLLRDIAHFHAVPLALKLKDPETFEKKVKAYLACHHPPAPVPPTEEPAAYIIEVLKESKTIEHLLPKLQKSFKYFGGYPESFREPFSTLVHRDLWVNNIMVRFENGEAVDSNLVDFQYYSYDSPATDLFFFLCTSVEKETLENNFDDLLKYYHKIFCDTLKSLKCDTDPFSYELFLEEIAASTERELARSIFMLFFIIHGQKGGLPRPQDTSKPPSIKGHTIRDETKEKVWWILEECEKRGWMNF